MSAIGPGDWVECVAPTSHPDVQPGSVHEVECVDPAIGDCPACGEFDPTGLMFVGHERHLHPSGVYWTWCPCRFRPIYRPKSSLIQGLLKPADAPADLQGVDA